VSLSEGKNGLMLEFLDGSSRPYVEVLAFGREKGLEEDVDFVQMGNDWVLYVALGDTLVVLEEMEEAK
jgi:hypothetical protein